MAPNPPKRISLKRLFRALLVGGLLVSLTGLGLSRGVIHCNYPSEAEFPVRGIDVSHHQQTIDWPKVAGQGVVFAYIKATEGGDFRDYRFLENWRAARAAGIRAGAYHFFTFCRPAIDQAKNFIATVPVERDPVALPPAIDVEYGGNCSKRPTSEALRSELAIFVKHVQAHYRRRPLLYITSEVYRDHFGDGAAALGCDLWIRDVFGKPSRDIKWTLWQYRSRDHFEGIKGYVDHNAFAGDRAQFDAWADR